MQLTPQQQQQAEIKFTEEVSKMTMSWDNELKEWYGIALRALTFTSAMSLNIPQQEYVKLLQTEKQGLNMKIIAALCNNVEARTPNQMGYTAQEWANILALNQKIAIAWNAATAPIRARVYKEVEIMSNKPQIMRAEA